MKLLLAALLVSQTPVRVSVDARGEDVREVIATLFAQVHRPYALDASIKGRVYVVLDRMTFPKALNVVLTQANLVSKDQDGVTLISPAPKPVLPPAVTVPPTPVLPEVSPAVFAHKVTTRLSRAPISEVFAALSEQAKVTIEVDSAVPAYRIDAFFAKTSLRYALDRLCRAANLRYETKGAAIRIVGA